ncbi:PREDICTED: flavin-containing monooxygenase FMO GS-OX-like 4 [Tarenaya hassleriana]|uniref:flavin-containing monooxygenase FMO GS-OX-like 4 n=1 Tax=Tarenaya hassleriana TaxID=28532 RepID=UPI00053C60A5|nr:PREDICTED: flavin-containing monooxygenase FMO GS-OX-like 4 [Tarenaya hassleriana]
MAPSLSPIKTHHVAVIGAGAAGLVAARELRREGHSVVVFERQNQAGGTWIYTDHVESDPLSLDPTRPVVHSSVYGSLRTNLPRECMGFRDFPFVTRPGESKDPRRFPAHSEVLSYLQEFVREFEIEEMIRFETAVVKVAPAAGDGGDGGKWRIESTEKGKCSSRDEIYDAVVVCNGHYIEPRLAEIPGISSWPGKQMHSHNFRVPEPFKDQVVVLIGSSASADDISRDIAAVAKEVHVVSRSNSADSYIEQPGYDNLRMHSMIERADEDGSVVFQNGRTVFADVIMHCTGYKYHFPFLETNGIVSVDDNRVGPLYKDVFPPKLAPWLSFIGIPWKVVPFPMFELQSKWIAGILSGRIPLPSEEEMMENVKTFYAKLEAEGIPKRYTHRMGNTQFEYNNWLASQCGCPEMEEWRKEMYLVTGLRKRARPETYRNEWDDHHLVSEALEDFALYTSQV